MVLLQRGDDMSEYNEEEHSCSECADCIDGCCKFMFGAKIEDINDKFVCMYFASKIAER